MGHSSAFQPLVRVSIEMASGSSAIKGSGPERKTHIFEIVTNDVKGSLTDVYDLVLIGGDSKRILGGRYTGSDFRHHESDIRVIAIERASE